MKKAWVENGTIRDICQGDPFALYHPDVAKFYATGVPDEAENGWVLENGAWRAPQVVAMSSASAPELTASLKVSPVQFKLLFTASERVAIKTARTSDPIIDDFYDIVEDPRLTYVDLELNSIQSAISYLQSKGLLTAERGTEVLAGKLL